MTQGTFDTRLTRPPRLAVGRRATIAAFALFALHGCGEQNEFSDQSLYPPTTFATPSGLLLFSPALDSVIAVQAGAESVTDARIALPGQVQATALLPNGQVAVLTSGEDALSLVDPATGRARRVPMSASFNAVSVDPEGRWLLLWYAPGTNGAGDDILFNPNEVGIVDLEVPTPAVRTISLAGPRPAGFVFAPEFSLGGDPLEMVVVLSANAVSFVDLLTDDPANVQRLVRLSDPASGAQRTPRNVVFTTDDPARTDDMTAYVIIANTTELYAIDLLPGDPASGRVLQPAINLLALNLPVADAVPFRVDGAEKLLITQQGFQLSVVDVATNALVTLDTNAVLTNVVSYTLVEDGAERPRAILYGQGSSVAYFADLDRLEDQGQGALRARQLSAGIERITLAEGASDTALARYSNGGGFGVLRLSTRAEVPIPARVALGNIVALGNLVFATVPGDSRLALLDVATNATGQVELPAPASSIVALPAAGVIAVIHSYDYITFYRPATLDEGPFAEVSGLLFDGILEPEHGGGAQ